MCKFEEGVTVRGVRGHLADESNVNDGRPVVSYQDNIGVVHPNRIASSAGHAIIQRATKGQSLGIEVSVYCENMRLRSASVQIAPTADVSA